MRRVLTTGLFLGSAGIALAAGLTVFTDVAAYIDALDQVEREGFEDAPLGTVSEGTVVDLGALTFSYDGSPDGGPNDIDDGQPLFLFDDTTLSVQFMGEVNVDGDPSGTHYFEFDEPIYAFGGEFIGAATGAGLTLSVGEAAVSFGTLSFEDILGGDGTGFLGVISEDPFSLVSFGTDGNGTSSSEVFRVEEIVFSADGPSPVPLPGSFWIMLIGLTALPFVKRPKS